MGPSGSGKSTLLGMFEPHGFDCLPSLVGIARLKVTSPRAERFYCTDIISGRKLAQRGVVLYGTQRPTRQFLKRFTSLVEQFGTQLH